MDYERKSWQSVLFFLAILLVTGVVGSQAWGRSHRFWLGAGLYGVIVWAILCISLAAKGATSRIQAPLWMNETGWSSKPYVFMLGWSYCTIASGHDASAQWVDMINIANNSMAEETQNPSRNVPNAMVSAMALTYVAGMISIALLLLSIGPDDVVIIKSHTFPVVCPCCCRADARDTSSQQQSTVRRQSGSAFYSSSASPSRSWPNCKLRHDSSLPSLVTTPCLSRPLWLGQTAASSL